MIELMDKLKLLEQAIPEAPEFVESVMRRLPAEMHASTHVSTGSARFMGMRLRAAAACILIGGIAALVAVIISASSRPTFAQVVQRVEKSSSVRYVVRSERREPNAPLSVNVEHRIQAGPRSRSDVTPSVGAPFVFIHNPQTSADADLILFPHAKRAEFSVVDISRDALSSDDPVQEFKEFAMQGAKAAPDEVYQGKPVQVYLSEKPELLSNGQSRTRRVLVDKENGFPIRIEIEGDMSKMGHGSYHDEMDSFEWNPKIDDQSFSTAAPAGYRVTYDVIKPLIHALDVYAGHFDRVLPDRVDEATLALLKKRIKPEQTGELFDAIWGFSTPAFAVKHKLDFRYYGAGKKLSLSSDPNRQIIAAVEIAPDAGQYDVLMSDDSRARLNRSQLP